MYDVFLLSYDESYAEQSFLRLKAQTPLARHVHGIKGILAAHKRCAEISRTKHFFVVDADNHIDDASVLRYTVPVYDAAYVHLWYAANPLTRMAYGWGGLKLFPRDVFDGQEMKIDMTTSFPLKVIPNVVSTSRFNVSALETWRSAFREAAKLTIGVQDRETRTRLHGWCNYASGSFAQECIAGARAGRAYAEENRDNPTRLSRINDYDWLSAAFAASAA